MGCHVLIPVVDKNFIDFAFAPIRRVSFNGSVHICEIVKYKRIGSCNRYKYTDFEDQSTWIFMKNK